MDDYFIRQATLADIDFLVETIVEAEKSGTNILSYASIFGLSEKKAKALIAAMFEEQIDGCELSISSYLIAEKNNETAAAASAWIEGYEGVSSSILKGNLLGFVLPKEAVLKARAVSHIVSELSLEYIPGSLCFGACYTSPSHRGKHLLNKLLQSHFQKTIKTNAKFDAYVQIFGNNIASINSFTKAGFQEYKISFATSGEITTLLPSNNKILMKKSF